MNIEVAPKSRRTLSTVDILQSVTISLNTSENRSQHSEIFREILQSVVSLRV